MKDIPKYSNLPELLPELLPVLKDSVQSDRLEIRKIDSSADKCQLVKEDFPVLENAVYVIYSKHIKKSEHQHETFIFLDEHGKSFSTVQLSEKLQHWRETWSNISLLVGGPDGLSQECLDRADAKWSLSPLTLPHPLVRIIIAEQVYRAWSILAKHPYHRA